MNKSYVKSSKVIVPVFAANSSSSFTRLNDAIKILLSVFPEISHSGTDKSEEILKKINFDPFFKMAALKLLWTF